MKFDNIEQAMSAENFQELPINEQVEIMHKSAMRDVEKAISDSGKTKSVWLATSSDATEMLYQWHELQLVIKEQFDFDVPDLIEGVKVTVK